MTTIRHDDAAGGGRRDEDRLRPAAVEGVSQGKAAGGRRLITGHNPGYPRGSGFEPAPSTGADPGRWETIHEPGPAVLATLLDPGSGRTDRSQSEPTGHVRLSRSSLGALVHCAEASGAAASAASVAVNATRRTVVDFIRLTLCHEEWPPRRSPN